MWHVIQVVLHQGQPAAASIVLSVYAIGSCLAGLAFLASILALRSYNRFAARGEMMIGRYYTFADEFQAILHRKVHTSDE